MKYRKNPADFEKLVEDSEKLRAALDVHDDDAPRRRSNPVLAVIFVLLFVTALILIVVFSKTNVAISVMIMGLIFMFIGTLGAINGLRSGNVVFLVFPLFGAGAFTISAFIAFGSEDIRRYATAIIPYAILALFSLAGLLLIVSRLLISSRKRRTCTEAVSARCIMHKCHFDDNDDNNSRRRLVICPVYEYYFDGMTYYAQEDDYSNVNVPELGERTELLINPCEPYDFFRPAALKNALYYILGAGFFLMPLAILMIMLFY